MPEQESLKLIKGNRYVIPAFFVTLANIVFLRSPLMSMTLVGIEVLVLLYSLYREDLERYLCWLLIFIATSIEFQALVSNDENDLIYGFTHYRILGLNLAIVFVLLPFVGALFKRFDFQSHPFEAKKPRFTLLMLLALMLDGIVMGFINLVLNDNGIRGIPNYLFVFIGEVYLGSWSILVFVFVYYALRGSRTNGEELGKALIAVLVANCTAPLLPASMGITGSYGDFPFMLISSSAMLSPFAILFLAYEKYSRHKMMFLALFVFGTIIPLVFFGYVGGKEILILLAIPIVYVLIQIKSRVIKRGRTVMIAVGLALFLFLIFSSLKNGGGTLFENKFNEAMSVLQIWKPDIESSMEPSSRFRVFEMINVFLEYQKKPFLILFGKGYMGSTLDYIGGFSWVTTAAFPLEQFDNGTFYSMHEIAGYLLKYGLLGLIAWLYVAKTTLDNIARNPWLVIGCYWFLLLFGFSLTVSIFGVLSLAYGLFLLKKDEPFGGTQLLE